MVLEAVMGAVLTLTETYFVLESFSPTRCKQFRWEGNKILQKEGRDAVRNIYN